MKKITMLVVCTLALALCATMAVAQTSPGPDTLKVNYFSNANTAGAPDGTVRITNPGTTAGNICAAIYVFDSAEEMSECCSCLITPDGLLTLSVNSSLTANPLTGVILTTGTVEIVSSAPKANTCPLPYSISPEPAVRAWGTHIQNANFAITETDSQDATLSSNEVSKLENGCSSINADGSGHGVCSCYNPD
jgi:hypothetical protein